MSEVNLSAGHKLSESHEESAGPSGCTLASRLARSATHPSVLLVEAGGQNDDPSLRNDRFRGALFVHPEIVWPYETVPQEHLNNRRISYVRGKGLGGSSALNFCVWTIGPKGDHNEIARLVGDHEWSWEKAQEHYKRIATTHFPMSQASIKRQLDPARDSHGTTGPIHISWPGDWRDTLPKEMDKVQEFGIPINTDANAGEPLGASVCAQSHFGRRSTASDILVDAPTNLKILTNAQIDRIVFKDRTAVGVEVQGSRILATKEIIISAGALDTPKLLMLSGIGPADHLTDFSIPIIQSIPRVGKGLKDHLLIRTTFKGKARPSNKQPAKGQVNSTLPAIEHLKTANPLREEIGLSCGLVFLKHYPMLETPEFAGLPSSRQRHLQSPTVPTWQFVIDVASPADESEYSNVVGVLFNAESSGEVTLKSTDPAVPAVFDPKFLSHIFDQRIAVEGLRHMLEFTDSVAFSKDVSEPVSVPKGRDDKELLEYWREKGTSMAHMTGTVKMGKDDDEEACVDNRFRVKGVKRLRVADMSVVPIMPKYVA